MDALRQDLIYAFRVLRKDRAYAAAVILTLAICLGANTAIFTVVRSVLLRPLPFQSQAAWSPRSMGSPAPASSAPARPSRTTSTGGR
jgi:putative ABC transport system permease protein